jgi:hypothetical protein
MLPALSHLSVNELCQPCAPVDALLPGNEGGWSGRESLLSSEELKRIPPNYQESRTDCVICIHPLSKAPPGLNPPRLRSDAEKQRDVIVAVDKISSCGHAFHFECLKAWFDEKEHTLGSLKCPLCASPFVDTEIDKLYRRIDGARGVIPPRRDGEEDGEDEDGGGGGAEGHPFELWDGEDGAGDDEGGADEELPLFEGPLEGEEWPIRRENNLGASYVLELIPGHIQINVPRAQVGRWKEYTYEHGRFTLNARYHPLFRVHLHIKDIIAYDKWVELLSKPDSRRSMWVKYYAIKSLVDFDSPLILAVKLAWDQSRLILNDINMTRQLTMEVLNDMREAHEEGNTWTEILLALTLGRA